jgi:DNA-binding transcriptional LysR family regulator
MTEQEVVLAVARRCSFRGAAQELGMSTTAVSSAVAGLEARLKVRLYNRSTRSVALTDIGQLYVERIAPALAQIKSADEEASDLAAHCASMHRMARPTCCWIRCSSSTLSAIPRCASTSSANQAWSTSSPEASTPRFAWQSPYRKT